MAQQENTFRKAVFSLRRGRKQSPKETLGEREDPPHANALRRPPIALIRKAIDRRQRRISAFRSAAATKLLLVVKDGTQRRIALLGGRDSTERVVGAPNRESARRRGETRVAGRECKKRKKAQKFRLRQVNVAPVGKKEKFWEYHLRRILTQCDEFSDLLRPTTEKENKKILREAVEDFEMYGLKEEWDEKTKTDRLVYHLEGLALRASYDDTFTPLLRDQGHSGPGMSTEYPSKKLKNARENEEEEYFAFSGYGREPRDDLDTGAPTWGVTQIENEEKRIQTGTVASWETTTRSKVGDEPDDLLPAIEDNPGGNQEGSGTCNRCNRPTTNRYLCTACKEEKQRRKAASSLSKKQTRSVPIGSFMD